MNPSNGLHRTLKLKEIVRKGWQRVGVADPESVADHSWGVAWLALNLCPPDLELKKVLTLALVHDLAEVITGDITPYDQIHPLEKQRREAQAVETLCRELPKGRLIRKLHQDYQTQRTVEARFVKVMDKLDMALQAQNYYQSCGMDPTDFLRSAHPHIHKAGFSYLL